MVQVNATTWTPFRDRDMLLEILRQSGLVPRKWELISTGLGAEYRPGVCQDRFKVLMTIRDLRQQEADGIPSTIGPVEPAMTIQDFQSEPARSVRESSETSETFDLPQDEGTTVWDPSESDSEEPTPQPKRKKRKSNRQGGITSTPVVEVDVDEEGVADFVDIDTLRTPHGQRTSNISFTRTNVVQKSFAPGAIPANGAASVPARQTNAGRQQIQQTPARPTTSNGNAQAHNANTHNTGRTSGNANQNQGNNNFRGRGGGRGGNSNSNGNGNGGHGQNNANRSHQRHNNNINNGRFRRSN